jgi:hypothetical protein
MADNTIIPPGSGGDTIRDIDRGTGSKTQVVQLDVGGSSANAESLVSVGNPLPVTNAVLLNVLQQILYTLQAMRLQDAHIYGTDVDPFAISRDENLQ